MTNNTSNWEAPKWTPYYTKMIFGERRAYIMDARIREATKKSTYSLQDLYKISKAFNVAFKLVPEPSEFPTEISAS
jgi:hypothetical protein